MAAFGQCDTMKQRIKLEKHKSPTPSHWREEAEYRLKNKSWLRHSQHIAVKMLERMEELGMTQQALANRLNCTQQYVSKVLKGRENLSLETLTKIEETLGLHLIYKEEEEPIQLVSEDAKE